ncbi:hypothetical protein MRX96_041817 [Rhipicephalus microplus]
MARRVHTRMPRGAAGTSKRARAVIHARRAELATETPEPAFFFAHLAPSPAVLTRPAASVVHLLCRLPPVVLRPQPQLLLQP